MINAKIAGMLVAAFMAGAFFTSPVQEAIAAVIATDVQCTGCVGTADLAGSAVTNSKLTNGAVNSAKIGDNSITAADIATDAVGASELQGVTKLLFGQCDLTNEEDTISLSPGFGYTKTCTIGGVDSDDTILATMTEGGGNSCMAITKTNSISGAVQVTFRNVCTSSSSPGAGAMMALMVYDK